ncbi:hypothetical protein BST81_25335 [Leptolyngbya sp. 'hensonii']|uniref:LmeA family phospholipid-binding protein n=1 Tax=Leptolyngbya sp. 'hensonii' TaxID=1922337 RepID=UPI00094FBB90|nr:DUF2993 domain-containing protein [Leptolyngbya sp. 'hensonii']OLP15602.1 hypothetical protein BST81_25335 [Leptolyngbya sp. 'hensonii']
MLGGLTGLTNPPGTDFGERMLNNVAGQCIRHLFTQSESVEVLVRCFPSSKLLQGSIDNFKMTGRGLVIRKDFYVAEMSFETDAVSIDFSSVLSGKIRLRQPTQAVAQVTLSEAGINRAFKAELVSQRMKQITMPALTDLSGGDPVSFSDVALKLLPQNRVHIFAKADLPNGRVPISLTATLAVERRRRILFQSAQFEPELVPESLRGVSGVLTTAFSQILNDMVDLDRFDLDGVTLRLNRLETQGDQLLFSGYAQIEHFPGSG